MDDDDAATSTVYKLFKNLILKHIKMNPDTTKHINKYFIFI